MKVAKRLLAFLFLSAFLLACSHSGKGVRKVPKKGKKGCDCPSLGINSNSVFTINLSAERKFS